MTAQISLTSAPSAAVKSVPSLSITHGLHQGVSLPLDKATYIIGSAGGADLLLSDPGIAERHVALRFAQGQVAVEALGGDVIVTRPRARAISIPVGSGHRARFPLDIQIGQARLTLSDPSAQAQSSAQPNAAWRLAPQWIIAILLMCLCVGVSAFSFSGSAVPVAAAQQDALPANADQSRTVATTAQARAWLDEQVATAGLHQIKVSQSAGQLSIDGSYDPEKKSRWMALQQGYDSRFGQQIVLHTHVVPRAEIANPRVRFQAVWFGPNPYVVNESGKRLYPGAALADDWTLQSIENDQVILARGEERFTFTL